MTEPPKYVWLGDWEGPKQGTYIIMCNGKELEPGAVIKLLDNYHDLLEQVIRTSTEALK